MMKIPCHQKVGDIETKSKQVMKYIITTDSKLLLLFYYYFIFLNFKTGNHAIAVI